MENKNEAIDFEKEEQRLNDLKIDVQNEISE